MRITYFRLTALFLFFCLPVLAAAQSPKTQTAKIEKQIRTLDLEAAKAILEKGERAIARFFTTDTVVNNPRNGLTHGSDGVIQAARTGVINYYSFDRQIESVQLLGDTVVIMGNETVVMKNPENGPGETIRRRYTNVWMKRGKNWRIVARHANIICR